MMPWAARSSARGLSAAQQEHLEALIVRYTTRTRKSKDSGAGVAPGAGRQPRHGRLPLSTKEMLYPIVGDRAAGSRPGHRRQRVHRFHDGLRVHLFGHTPDFIQQQVTREWQRPLELGARSSLVGEVAARFARVTGLDRVAFSNTGTEAVSDRDGSHAP